MKQAILAVSARPSEASKDGAEIIAASPNSGSFGPIRRGPMLLTRIPHLMSVAGQTGTSTHPSARSALPLILLQKSFWGGDRKFLKPLMRFTRGEVRDHIVSSEIDHAPP
jgi:hypothetical protein